MNHDSLGILGGGQLAMMLVGSAARLGLGEISVLETAGPACPAALAGARVEARAEDFFARVRTAVFENEFVDCDRLEGPARAGVTFQPSLAVIRRLQDKFSQKCALHELGIATSPFEAMPDGDIGTWLGTLGFGSAASGPGRFPRGVALKWARLGYDGKGVCPLRSSDGFARARAFCEEARKKGVGIYAEEWIEYRRELAVVACRSRNGELVAYPLVESKQQDGVCLWVRGPLADVALTAQAHALARRLGEGVGLVGTFALELFETRDGRLLVNELAPRVHNTGHYSQDAAETSQFENHWRAVLGRELGRTRTRASFAMLNLLGPAGLERELDSRWKPEPGGPGLFPHWYGKTTVRPGRKLGHVNAVSDDPDALASLVARLEEWHARWEKSLRTPVGAPPA